MAQPDCRVIVLEQFQVAPPANSVPTTSLPLTFLDIPWLFCCPMQRLFFYELPHSTHHFTQNILPTLKHSLSLSLQHFFPLAADLVCPPKPRKPYLLYTEGNSAVTVTVAECNGDFNHLLVNSPRDVRELHSFVPPLPPAHRVSVENTHVSQLMCMQLTVFPNAGICVGVTFCHVVADGRAFHHFMKSWASICKTGGDLNCLETSPPFHNRTVIQDPNGLEQTFLEEWWKEERGVFSGITGDKIRATFVLGRSHIERLKHWVRNQCENEDLAPSQISTFVVTCALIWVCLIKSQLHGGVGNFSDNDELCYFIFVADCRNRLHEVPIPSNYFGNCLAINYVPLPAYELVRETGILKAVKTIGNRVRQLETGALRGADTWMSDLKEIFELRKNVSVAGSPRLGVYETDFGWGKPKKTEVVHIDASGAVSLAECRDEDGAIEIGLALSRRDLGNFESILEQSLKQF